MAHNGHKTTRASFQDARNMLEITCILCPYMDVFSLSFCTHHALIEVPLTSMKRLSQNLKYALELLQAKRSNPCVAGHSGLPRILVLMLVASQNTLEAGSLNRFSSPDNTSKKLNYMTVSQ